MKTKRLKVLLGAAVVLLMAWAISSCSKKSDATPALADKTVLNDSITAANVLLSTTVEGIQDGQHVVGSKATLQTAVIEAQIVSVVPDVDQTAVANAIVSLTAATTAYRAATITPVAAAALVGHWSFDEGSGTTAGDVSGHAFSGAFKAGPAMKGGVSPSWTSDRKGDGGKAIQFNNGASVEVPYNTALNPTALSMALWIKVDTIDANNRFIGLQSWLGFKFQVQDLNHLFSTVQTSQGDYDRDSETAIPANQWHHVAVTFVDGRTVFYIDGDVVHVWTDTPGTASSISATPYNLVFGADFPVDKYSLNDGTNFNTVGDPDYHVIPLAWGGHFIGALDEIRIYNIALTDAQITAIYDREK